MNKEWRSQTEMLNQLRDWQQQEAATRGRERRWCDQELESPLESRNHSAFSSRSWTYRDDMATTRDDAQGRKEGRERLTSLLL